MMFNINNLTYPNGCSMRHKYVSSLVSGTSNRGPHPIDWSARTRFPRAFRLTFPRSPWPMLEARPVTARNGKFFSRNKFQRPRIGPIPVQTDFSWLPNRVRFAPRIFTNAKGGESQGALKIKSSWMRRIKFRGGGSLGMRERRLR